MLCLYKIALSLEDFQTRPCRITIDERDATKIYFRRNSVYNIKQRFSIIFHSHTNPPTINIGPKGKWEGDERRWCFNKNNKKPVIGNTVTLYFISKKHKYEFIKNILKGAQVLQITFLVITTRPTPRRHHRVCRAVVNSNISANPSHHKTD